MTDAPAAAAPLGSPARRQLNRAAALTSSGLLVGLGAFGAATPAVAAEATDCTDANTVDTGDGGSAIDVQLLLDDAGVPVVCIAGTFFLTSPLTVGRDVTLFGLAGAQLDGDNLTSLISGSTGADLTVQNITFVDGSGFTGGAIYVDASLSVENSQFIGNTAVEDGGAIYVDGSNTVLIEGSTFTNNATGPVLEGSGYSGGAIFSAGSSSVNITESTFAGNTASESGGAVAGYAVIAELSEFSDNEAPLGGAMYAAVTVAADSTFTSNAADEGGAVRSVLYGATFGSTFLDNSATDLGGALAIGLIEGGIDTYGALISLNSTFVENSAVVGGAVLADYGLIGLSTFLDNEASTTLVDEQSDAVFVTGFEGEMGLGGNIFAGSRASAQVGAISPTAIDDLGGNVFSTAAGTEVALGTPHPSTRFSRTAAAIFGPSPTLGDNGGPTDTLALIASSPAVDAVPAGVIDFLTTTSATGLAPVQQSLEAAAELLPASDSTSLDQRSVERTGLADAGAYEFGDAELAATGADTGIAGWLAAIAALLVGSGAAVALGARRRSRSQR